MRAIMACLSAHQIIQGAVYSPIPAETVAGKKLVRNYIDGPLGVRGRNSDNTLIKEKLGWAPHYPLLKGITHTYDWIYDQINISTLKTEA